MPSSFGCAHLDACSKYDGGDPLPPPPSSFAPPRCFSGDCAGRTRTNKSSPWSLRVAPRRGHSGFNLINLIDICKTGTRRTKAFTTRRARYFGQRFLNTTWRRSHQHHEATPLNKLIGSNCFDYRTAHHLDNGAHVADK